MRIVINKKQGSKSSGQSESAQRRLLGVGAAAVGLTMVLAGCQSSNGDTEDTGDVTAVATTSIWGDVVSQITTCAGGTSATLMPVGADPHDYKPSSADAAQLRGVSLVVANGLGLEEGFAETLSLAEEDGVKVFEVGPELDPIPVGEDDHADEHSDDEHSDDDHGHADDDHSDEHSDDEHSDDDHGHADDDHSDEHSDEHAEDESDEGHDGHDHTGDDPHVWMDATRTAKGAELIGQKLADVTGDQKYVECGETVASGLRDLNKSIKAQIEKIPADQRKVVSDHNSLAYYAQAYGLTVVGSVIPSTSTLAEPSSGELASLQKEMKEQNVKVIFVEEGKGEGLAQALAKEGSNISVVPIYVGSLGPADSGAATYTEMMNTDTDRISSALG